MNKENSVKLLSGILTVLMCIVFAAGCDDPQTIGRFQATPVTNIILNNLGVVDEEPEPFANARSPRQEDLLVSESEYVIRSGDILNVSILDLFQTNAEWATQKQVSESGRITIPEIGSVMAAGYTERELQKSIESALSPEYIKDPKVSVVVAASTGKVYTVTGAVPAPAPYQLTEPDLRVLKALAHAGDVPPRGVDFVYVIRKVPTSDLITEPGDDVNTGFEMPTDSFSPVEVPVDDSPDISSDFDVVDEPALEVESEAVEDKTVEKELMESISPMSVVSAPAWTEDQVVMASDSNEDGFEIVMGEDGFEVEGDGNSGSAVETAEPVQGGMIGYKPLQYRHEVIKINLKELKNGDLSQNIVIQPGDYISVPYNSTGVYYVMGQASRPGPYQMTGERMTLKQAIASVGGLSPLASPERCDITRITGNNTEVTYRVNLKKLFEGVQPDIYIKANDMINIGSHPTARWMAVIRQSFRTTYGFGFVYDRNLADVDFGNR